MSEMERDPQRSATRGTSHLACVGVNSELCTGGVYVPCIHTHATHARWELPKATQFFVAVFVLRISSAN